MPVLGVFLTLVGIGLAIHAGKTGRPFFWVYLLIFVPGLGTLAYIVVELLPEMLGSYKGQKAVAGLGKMIDPGKEYRKALRQMQISDTVDTRSRLAEICIASGRYDEAMQLYNEALVGIHAEDSDLFLGLARAAFGKGDYAACQATLERLRQANPDYRSPEGHLLYARSLELQGKIDEAMREYDALMGYYPGQEPKCRYAMLLKESGRTEDAKRLFGEVCQAVEYMPRHARRVQREWYDLAKRHMPA